MSSAATRLEEFLASRENEHLEFKEAKSSFEFDKLVRYCAALANEGGGSIVLGVGDTIPRRVVGTQAFDQIERTKAGLISRLRLRIDVDEMVHPNGRVLVFTAPARPIGVPIAVEGAYWMRAGEDLVPMTPDMLRRIFAEAGPDFSSEICADANLGDLDSQAIEELRTRWVQRAELDSLRRVTPEQLLRDAELVTDAGVTYAALVLLGTSAALGRHLPNAEVVFEYRSNESAGPANQRAEFRQGFLGYYDRVWELVNLRNDRQHYQDGLFMVEIPTFSETAVREALLNAVSHRDYRHAGSVFVRQYQRRIEIVSPGGFPPGITAENFIDRQQPRNRRIADVLSRCGLVERSGQGANRIFESCIREGKPLPDFSQTDAWQVGITLHGQVQDPMFVRFLERVGSETSSSFDTRDFLVLDLVHREDEVPVAMRPRLRRLMDQGVIESVGRGRGTRYFLSRRFYSMTASRGVHTRRRGLDRETNKELLLRHLRDSPDGSPLSELHDVLPGVSRGQLQRLLAELKRSQLARLAGQRRGARWFATAHTRE